MPALRTLSRSSIAQWAAYVLLTAYFCAPLFANPHGLGISDWDQHFVYYGAVVKSIYGFGQLPFWNPWSCGGTPLWQNPQVALLSPVYLLAGVVSLTLALKINIVLHVFAGLAGMRRLVRGDFQNQYFPLELFLASLFAFEGGTTLHVAIGHSTFLTFLSLPWALSWALEAFDTGKVAPGAKSGAILALAIFNGGFHAVAMFVLIISVVALVISAFRRTAKPFLALAVIGIATALLAAPKLVPVLSFFRDPRFIDTRAGLGEAMTLTWTQVLTTLAGTAPRNRSGWYEFGNYIGLLAVALAAGAVWAAFDRRTRSATAIGLTAALVACLLLVRGRFSELAPYALLQHVPIYSGFRVPSRYTILIALVVPALIAEAARNTWRLWTSPGPRVLVSFVLAIAAIDIAVTNRAVFQNVFTDRLLPGVETLTERSGPPAADAQTAGDGPDSPMVRALAENRSVIQCYDPLHITQTMVPDRPLLTTSAGTAIHDVDYGPSRVRFVATTQTAGAITFNQNDLTGWRTSKGSWMPGVGAPPQVVLPAGFSGPVTIRFIPAGLWLGLALFAAGLAAFLRVLVKPFA